MEKHMKGITCCGDCAHYSCEKHRCRRGFCKEDDPRDRFFSECDLPDVQPVVHGKWLTKEYMYGDPDTGTEDKWVERLAEQSDYFAYCSECDKGAGYDSDQSVILSEYCQHCGAKMDLED